MIKNFHYLLILVALPLLLSGCSVIEGVFKAGMWWAFFLVALVIGVIVWAIAKGRK
ncbi:MAG: hypothetical protein ABIU11_04615 [Chitinophagaceae bacterium]